MISNLEIKFCFLHEWNYNGMDKQNKDGLDGWQRCGRQIQYCDILCGDTASFQGHQISMF